ncbi:MAG: hypothetical protein HZA54_02450 [Planctomycetes bacterium]|nr:hypothetical protein [Planctomycetota bacterium]
MKRSDRAQFIAGKDVSYRREVEYIVGRALAGVACIVSLGPLVFFSSDTGDAWVLDAQDGDALPLARGGARLPVRMVETQGKLVVNWTCDFRIEGELFVVAERKGGRIRSIAGYPTDEIARACARAR